MEAVKENKKKETKDKGERHKKDMGKKKKKNEKKKNGNIPIRPLTESDSVNSATISHLNCC